MLTTNAKLLLVSLVGLCAVGVVAANQEQLSQEVGQLKMEKVVVSPLPTATPVVVTATPSAMVTPVKKVVVTNAVVPVVTKAVAK